MWRKLAGILALLLARLAVKLGRYARTDDAAREIRVTTTIAGWPPATADSLAASGVGHRAAAAMFRDALARIQ
jgi:hypothetical protein